MRVKLIELLNNAWEKAEEECGKHFDCGDCRAYEYCPKNCMTALTADHLIANGVVMAPCRIGETIYMIVTVRRRPNLPKVSFVKTTHLTESNFFEVIRRYGKTVFLTKEEAVAHLPEPPQEDV